MAVDHSTESPRCESRKDPHFLSNLTDFQYINVSSTIFLF